MEEDKELTLQELRDRLTFQQDIYNRQVKVLDLTKELFGQDELCYCNTLREVLDTERSINKIKNDINIISMSINKININDEDE